MCARIRDRSRSARVARGQCTAVLRAQTFDDKRRVLSSRKDIFSSFFEFSASNLQREKKGKGGEKGKGRREEKVGYAQRQQRGDFECTTDETSPRGGGFIVIKS